MISTTAAAEPIVSLDQYVRVQRARRNRLALILDIAIPRDFDPRIGDLDQVTLYHVDDLRTQAEQNRLQRHGGIDPALVIIERETAACYAQLRHQRDAGLLLQQLGNHADQIRQRELGDLFATRANLSEEDRKAITHMAVRLQNQLLHHPRAAVRSAVVEPHHDHDRPHPLLDSLRICLAWENARPMRPRRFEAALYLYTATPGRVCLSFSTAGPVTLVPIR